jgi:hypothetical protein
MLKPGHNDIRYDALVAVSSTPEHLFFDVFDVGELAPTSDIAVFTGALNLHNEFFH